MPNYLAQIFVVVVVVVIHGGFGLLDRSIIDLGIGLKKKEK